MGVPHGDSAFGGSIPERYEAYLVPLIFEPYAADLAGRIAPRSGTRVLEVAAGTGVATRALAATLPEDVAIVATDLNQPMLDHAAALGTRRPVEWRRADALQLPFPDATFDAVVCQFGAMFFPDKPRAFAEARRVLRAGGTFIFSVWDRLEENAFADAVTTALAALFPADPPRILARTPPRLLRAAGHRARPGRRWVRRTRASRDGRRAQPRALLPGPGDRVLPGDAPTQRGRGAHSGRETLNDVAPRPPRSPVKPQPCYRATPARVLRALDELQDPTWDVQRPAPPNGGRACGTARPETSGSGARHRPRRTSKRRQR